MTIEGISHITFIVKDLERSATLFKAVLGAEEIYSTRKHQFSLAKERFFLIGGVWLALMEGNSNVERNYNHIAFKIPASAFEQCKNRLEAAGVEFLEGRKRVPGEGLSLYFYDYDNHLMELHTGILEERLDAYRRYIKA